MLLELTLYFIFGFMLLLIKKADSFRCLSRGLLFVAAWPYFILLKYVEFVDKVKKENRER